MSEEISCEVYENEPAGTTLATLEARSATSPWYTLQGGGGLFRLNPAAGLLATAAPLDYEARQLYNLTVTALGMVSVPAVAAVPAVPAVPAVSAAPAAAAPHTALPLGLQGGGSATARVLVHVLDRNEFAPRLLRRDYRGRVSEAAPPGALVRDLAGAPDGADPLVLDTDDGDSPAHTLRAFEISDPSAAELFHVDPTTGALRLARQLDYETQPTHRFTVRVSIFTTLLFITLTILPLRLNDKRRIFDVMNAGTGCREPAATLGQLSYGDRGSDRRKRLSAGVHAVDVLGYATAAVGGGRDGAAARGDRPRRGLRPHVRPDGGRGGRRTAAVRGRHAGRGAAGPARRAVPATRARLGRRALRRRTCRRAHARAR